MKVMKKKLSVILAVLLMAFAMQGCGKTAEIPDPVAALEIFHETEETVSETTEVLQTEAPEESVWEETEFYETAGAYGEYEDPEVYEDDEEYGETEGEYPDETNGNVCYISISCETVLDNYDLCDPDKWEIVPDDGVILHQTEAEFTPGESVFDVLQRVCQENGVHMESEWTPMYNSAYIEGIYNLYEFDVGSDSGWMYQVNGWFPNYGCSKYMVEAGDVIQWQYTCDLGGDIGGANVLG